MHATFSADIVSDYVGDIVLRQLRIHASTQLHVPPHGYLHVYTSEPARLRLAQASVNEELQGDAGGVDAQAVACAFSSGHSLRRQP